MTMTAERTQREVALASANRIRAENAQLKQAIARAGVDARSVVAGMLEGQVDGSAGSLTIESLLLAIPRMGVKKARRLLAVAQTPPYWRVRQLTGRQRDLIASLLREQAHANCEVRGA